MIFLVRLRERRWPRPPKAAPGNRSHCFCPRDKSRSVRMATRDLLEPALQRRVRYQCLSWRCSSRKAFSRAVATAGSPLARLAGVLGTVEVPCRIGGARWEERRPLSHGLFLLCRDLFCQQGSFRRGAPLSQNSTGAVLLADAGRGLACYFCPLPVPDNRRLCCW